MIRMEQFASQLKADRDVATKQLQQMKSGVDNLIKKIRVSYILFFSFFFFNCISL